MPYKSEKIPLAEKQDRRRKLMQEQKDEIVSLYATGFHSLRSLGRQFGVDKSYIKILVDPERAQTVKNRIKEHWQDYVPTKEQRNEIMRKHRYYKHGLYLKGEMKMQLIEKATTTKEFNEWLQWALGDRDDVKLEDWAVTDSGNDFASLDCTVITNIYRFVNGGARFQITLTMAEGEK
jgi:hypothetical protein